MKHAYEVLFHTGDGWGRGCASVISFEVVGSEGRLLSSQCIQKDVHDPLTMRAKALQYIASKVRAESKNPGALGPPMEKRNVFALFSAWLKSEGGAGAMQQLVRDADGSADGLLSMEEVKGLLAKAVPSVSDLEAQLFVAMVDLNGDGAVSEQELVQSVADCADIDAVVAAGGSTETAGAAGAATPRPAASTAGAAPASTAGAAPAASATAGMASTLESLVQHLRTNVVAVHAKLTELSPTGGYLSFTQLNELFQAVTPETMGGREAIRALMAHVARTAHISATDPGVHVAEFKRCFGLQAVTPPGGPAAVAAGWVPGRPRDVFRLLRYHVKHNRAQLDELYPRGSELTLNQVRHLARQLLDTRVGEPPLTGREARHLVAALDANGNGLLSREEFDSGLKECRDLAASMSKLRTAISSSAPGGSGSAPDVMATLLLPEPSSLEPNSPPPTLAAFVACLAALHEYLVAHHEEAEATWRRNDSRGKGRLDACELQRTLMQLVPTTVLSPLMLRALLIYLDSWDPSDHALLSRKHFLMALRRQEPPTSLQPPPLVPLVAPGDGVTAAASSSLEELRQQLTKSLYGTAPPGGGSRSGRAFLPDPERWRTWHGNIKTRERTSGSVVHGGAPLPPRPGFWKAQWRWHTKWLEQHAAYRRTITGPPAPNFAGGGGGASGAAAGAAPPPPGPDAEHPPNTLQTRMRPAIAVTDVPYLCAAFHHESPKLTTAGLTEPSPSGPPTDTTPTNGATPAAATFAPANPSASPDPAAAAVVQSSSLYQSSPAPAAAAATVGVDQPPLSLPAAQQQQQQLLPAGSPQLSRAGSVRSATLAGRGTQPGGPPGQAVAEGSLSEGVDSRDPAALGPMPEGPDTHAAAAGGHGVVGAGDGVGVGREGVAPGAAMMAEAGGLGGGDATGGAASGSAAAGAPVEGALAQPAAGTLPGGGAAAPAPRSTAGSVAGDAAAAVGGGSPLMSSRRLQGSRAASVSGVAQGSAAACADAGAAAAGGGGGPPPTAVRSSGPRAAASDAALLMSSAFVKVAPLVAPTRTVRYQVILATGSQLGNFLSINVRNATGGKEAWYLERVEVRCTTMQPPLAWEVTVRRWMQPGEELTGLRADACAWQEWDMQADSTTGRPTAVLYLNSNRQECVWLRPPPPPIPSLPGALPDLYVSGDMATTPPDPGQGQGQILQQQTTTAGRWEALRAVTPSAVQRCRVRHLDALRTPPMFRTTRVRPHYKIGFGGELGIIPGQQVRVKGQSCSNSISVQARGGFKWLDPDGPVAPRLLPATGAVNSGGFYNNVREAPVDHLGGGLIPGIRECVVLSFNLEAAGTQYNEQYGWLYGHVALDDSSGTPPAPVRFSVIKDGSLAWAGWVEAAGSVRLCCVPLHGCRNIDLVVESDFSGGAHCVWVDPILVCTPLHGDDLLQADLAEAARTDNEVAEDTTLDMKVDFRHEGGGCIVYMAPSRSVPPEVARSSSTAMYRVTIYTAPDKGSGTRGKVFVRLNGRRSATTANSVVKSNIIHVNPDGAALLEGNKFIMSEAVAAPMMEEIDSIVVQHVPPPAGLMGGSAVVGGANDWKIQHVEVFCEDTGRTWYFVANGWFLELALQQLEKGRSTGGVVSRPKALQPADASVMLEAVKSDTILKVVFHIFSSGKGVGMGIDGDLQMIFVGLSAEGYQSIPFTLPGGSIDRPHETRLMTIPSPIGELQSLELSCRQKGLLSSRLQCVEVVRLCDGKHFLFLQPRPDDQEMPYDNSSTRVVLRAAAQSHFVITTHTSALPEASTDAKVYIDLFGSRGKLLDLYLRDFTGDAFNEGAEDVFFFPDPGLGDLGSVCISHDDSGDSPNWHLDRVEVTVTGSNRTTTFPCRKWIGLRADIKDEAGEKGKFGDQRVLERVLYPSSIISKMQSDEPPLRYHLVFTMEGRGELWHIAEAVQFVGRDAQGTFKFSDIIILEKHFPYLDQELDMQYVKHVQHLNREQLLGDDGGTNPRPAISSVVSNEQQGQAGTPPGVVSRVYQVTIKKSALYQPYRNIVALPLTDKRLELVLHGSLASSRPLLLNSESNVAVGVTPYISEREDDVFQVSTNIDLGATLLRAVIRMPSTPSGSAGNWGLCLQAITVCSTSKDTATQEVEFSAGSVGQWLGLSPDGPDGVLGGAQEVHLLPVGVCATSFMARPFHEVAVLHVRHDNPAAFLGWKLQKISVLASPLSGSGIKLYQFPSEPQNGWPNVHIPYIRHFLEEKFLREPFPPEMYFKQPILQSQNLSVQGKTSASAGAVMNGAHAQLLLQGNGEERNLLAVDAQATAALIQKADDPERLQALLDAFSAELELFKSAPSGNADYFALMRAYIRAKPSLLATAFEKLDHDHDGKLNHRQVCALIPVILPSEVESSPRQQAYLASMLTLGLDEPMSQDQIMSALKSSRSAYREASSMARILELNKKGGSDELQSDSLGVEMALCTLAQQLVQPESTNNAAEAFKMYDTDGSGYLEIGELCKALNAMTNPKLTSWDVRLLLAYLFYHGDTDEDMRLSVQELQSSLKPFVKVV